MVQPLQVLELTGSELVIASNNPLSRIDPMGLQDFLEEGIRRNAAAKAPSPVEQLPEATDLPTPDFDRYKDWATRRKQDLPYVRNSWLMPTWRDRTIRAIIGMEHEDRESYNNLRFYEQAGLERNVAVGSIVVGGLAGTQTAGKAIGEAMSGGGTPKVLEVTAPEAVPGSSGSFVDEPLQIGQRVGRYYGGKSSRWGRFWSRDTGPTSRNALGIEEDNAATHYIEGVVTDTEGVEVTPGGATRWGRMAGGADEVRIPNPRNQIKVMYIKKLKENLPTHLDTDPYEWEPVPLIDDSGVQHPPKK